jgi:hypothetical protein
MRRNGATIDPWYRTRAYKGIDFSSINQSIQKVRYYENGGTIQDARAAETNNNGQVPAILLPEGFDQLPGVMQQISDRLKEEPKAYVVFSEIQAANDT